MQAHKIDATRLIDSVEYPSDIRAFNDEQLVQFCEELREETINAVSKIGGHLGAGLGVVELTAALHYVFKTPKDKIIWDVGHQGYPHKILTGRKKLMHTLRQGGGLSGFLKRTESEYDAFGAGHSSTSISAALGMAVARDLNKDDYEVVAVIGDGALTAGMAYEAMNNAGHLRSRMIVILNDNDMSIAPNVGAMQKYLNRMMSSKPFLSVRGFAKNMLHHMPSSVESFAKKTKKYTKDFVTGGNFFEELGFHYVGPLDGHDVLELKNILQNIRDDRTIESPILIHVKTQKGKGFNAPYTCGESYHAAAKFDPVTKEQFKPKSVNPTYTKVFGQTLSALADEDEKIVGITAAMPSGTGINIFSEKHSDKTFDVGIAEQHAVTFAAGLAAEGIKPFTAIYSTFLQRAYDQVVHDVAIQKLPVRLVIDRAGLVGADGATHAGTFDLVYLCSLPNMIVMAPSDEAELALMLKTMQVTDDLPTAVRFPRGEGTGVEMPKKLEPLEIGKAKTVHKGKKVAVISLGTRLEEVKKASDVIKKELNFDLTIVDARFAKPFDQECFKKLAQDHDVVITVEEGAAGGFGSHVAKFYQDNQLMNGKKFYSMFLPDEFMDHDNPNSMYEKAELNCSGIVKVIKELI